MQQKDRSAPSSGFFELALPFEDLSLFVAERIWVLGHSSCYTDRGSSPIEELKRCMSALAQGAPVNYPRRAELGGGQQNESIMQHATIVSTGIHVPEREVSNAELKARLEADNPEFVDKMAKSSGIGTRWYAAPGDTTSDLVVRAAQDALARAGVAPAKVDLLIVGTDSPDFITPSTSVVAQAKLGALNAGTFDVGCACASFPTALANAAALMAAQPHLENVLVVGAYMMQRLADPNDPMIFFYGDGAGAALLQRSVERQILGAAFRADGNYARDWAILSGGTAEPASVESVNAGRTQVHMEKKYPPSVNDEGWPAVVRDLCKHNHVTPDDVDHYIFTQVRKRTIEKVMGFIDQPVAKAHTVMEKWGYTGSACIPMALHDLVDSGKGKAGDLVFLVGSGVGYNQAGIALRLSDELLLSHGTDSLDERIV